MSDHGMFVYFVKPVGAPGPVKIGVSNAPVRRLQQLMAWSPSELEVVATIPGDRSVERAIHECFADDFLRHEWFNASDRLTKLMQDLSAGIDLADAIDLTQRKPLPPTGKRSAESRRKASYSHRISWIERKHHLHAPADVEAIMREWGSQEFSVRRPPTEQEIARLDEFIAGFAGV